MQLNELLFEQIAKPFFAEIELKNHWIHSEPFKNPVYSRRPKQKRNKMLKIIKESLADFDEENSYLLLAKAKKREHDLYLTEKLLKNIIIDLDQKLNNETKFFLIQLFIQQMFLSSIKLEEMNEINIYIEFAEKFLNLMEAEKITLSFDDALTLNHLRRHLYLAIHKIRFEPNERQYGEYIQLLEKDRQFSFNINCKESLIASRNYFLIILDYLSSHINDLCIYVNLQQFLERQQEYKNEVIRFIKNYKNSPLFNFSIFSVFLYLDLYKLKLKRFNRETIDSQFKKEILLKIIAVIKIFEGDIKQFKLFFSQEHKQFKSDYQSVTDTLKKSIQKLLKSQDSYVIELLYIILSLLVHFPEFLKTNINIYKKIQVLSRKICARKILILSNVLYLKSFHNQSIFKKEISQFKQQIEHNPVISLIHHYNNELLSIADLSDDLKNRYKIDLNLIQIHDKIFFINKMIFNYILDFKKGYLTNTRQLKLNYLTSVRTEMKNIFEIASNPYLITDLGQLYVFFIDSYIKKNRIEYRGDFINKASSLKMEIFDVNPLNLTIALLFSKLGKFKLIIEHSRPDQLGLNKKFVTNDEKEKIASYIGYSKSLLPKTEEGINWDDVRNTIDNIRKPAFMDQAITPLESRILKVISAIVNKVNRQSMISHNVFPTLYEEAYISEKKVWDLDPVLIFYFNNYFSRRKKNIFYHEKTGEKRQIKFAHLNHSSIHDLINTYIKDLIEKTAVSRFNVEAQIEDLTHVNEEPIAAGNSGKVFSKAAISEMIDQQRTIFLEKPYIESNDIISLLGIMRHYLTLMDQTALIDSFKYIFLQLIAYINQNNYKQAFFQLKKINPATQYRRGIEQFKKNYQQNMPGLKKVIRDIKLKIRVEFLVYRQALNICFINNFQLHREELKRLDECILKARDLVNLIDLYRAPLADRENDESGIMIAFLFLRKVGLGNKFRVNIKENETKIQISVPLSHRIKKEDSPIIDKMTRQVERIPHLPPEIEKLKNMPDHDEREVKLIEEIVLKQPALSHYLLKLVNSGYYSNNAPLNSLEAYLETIQPAEIKNLILAAASFHLLEKKVSPKRIEEIMQHSIETAFYVKKIILFHKSQSNQSALYLAALLHDIGKILVEELEPDIYKKIETTIEGKGIPIELIEDLAGGIHHAQIGYLIAQRWHLSSQVCQIIRYHHNPQASGQHSEAVFILYFANILTNFNAGKIVFESIDQTVLDYFQISNSQLFYDLIAQFSTEFKKNRPG